LVTARVGLRRDRRGTILHLSMSTGRMRMAAYLIAEIEISDPETYDKYKARTPGVIEQYGGRFIVRGGKAQQLEGEREPGRLVVIEFPDVAAARRFYDSPEYRAIIGLRQRASKGRLILVEGVSPNA
jgi:uncharacterized protein (DUF1330 family)